MWQAIPAVRQRLTSRRGTAIRVLALLLAADLLILLFYALHVVCRPLGWFQDEYWSLEMDRGLGESFQYVQTFWTGLMLLAVSFRSRELIFLAWSAVFAWILLDDSLQWHERAGAVLSHHLGLLHAVGLRPEDVGELLVFAAAAALLLSFLVPGYLLASAPARRSGRRLACIALAMAVAGGFFDVLHSATRGMFLSHLLGLAEDWGELLVMSAACAYAFHLLTAGHSAGDCDEQVRG